MTKNKGPPMPTNKSYTVGMNDAFEQALETIATYAKEQPVPASPTDGYYSPLVGLALQITERELTALTPDRVRHLINTYYSPRSDSYVPGKNITISQRLETDVVPKIGAHIHQMQLAEATYLKRGKNYSRPIIIAVSVGFAAEHLPVITQQWIQAHETQHPNGGATSAP